MRKVLMLPMLLGVALAGLANSAHADRLVPDDHSMPIFTSSSTAPAVSERVRQEATADSVDIQPNMAKVLALNSVASASTTFVERPNIARLLAINTLLGAASTIESKPLLNMARILAIDPSRAARDVVLPELRLDLLRSEAILSSAGARTMSVEMNSESTYSVFHRLLGAASLDVVLNC